LLTAIPIFAAGEGQGRLTPVLQALAWIVGGFALSLAAGWLGLQGGRHVARKNPSVASALWMLSVFLKIDPPPPPKAERVLKDEDRRGEPPVT
jgi:hypothetical protein